MLAAFKRLREIWRRIPLMWRVIGLLFMLACGLLFSGWPPHLPSNPFPQTAATSTIHPEGDGTYHQLQPQYTTNYQRVDDTGTGDGDTTYVYTPTTSNTYYIDLYETQNFNLPSGYQIDKVTVYIRVRSTSADAFQKKSTWYIMVKTSAEYAYLAGSPDTTYTLYSHEFPTNPNGSAWTESAVNAMEIGEKGKSGTDTVKPPYGAYYSGRCTQTYAVVEYSIPLRSELWVSSFDETEVDWTEVGSSPYLNNNTDSYIYYPSVGYNESWFEFQPTSKNVQQTFLWMLAQGNANISITLNDGTTNHTYSMVWGELREWHWINVSDALSSSTINEAKMRIHSKTQGSSSTRIYACFLRVFYGASFYRIDASTPQKSSQNTVSSKWADPDGLSSYNFSYYNGSSWQSSTGTLSGNEAWVNVTITNPSTDTLQVRIRTNDSSNNWEELDWTFPLVKVSYTSEKHNTVSTVGSLASNPLGHSYGRKTFIADNANVTLVFYKATSTCINYSYSLDQGETWNSGGTVRENAGSGENFYGWVEENGTSGKSFFHYVFNNETTGSDIYYRKGEILSNGTINWAASEQTVVDGTDKFLYPCSVTTDTDGHAYITYGLHTSPYNFSVIKNYNVDGTWQTDSGFPKDVDSGELTSGSIRLLNDDNDMYIIYGHGDSEPLRGKVLYANETLGSRENVTNSAFAKLHHQFITAHGEVYAVAGQGTVYFSHRNSTGDWDIKEYTVGSGYGRQIAYYPAENLTVISWVGAQEKIGYYYYDNVYERVWNETSNEWKNTERIFIEKTVKMSSDSLSLSPLTYEDGTAYCFVGDDNKSSSILLRSCYYLTIEKTVLSTGWNNFTAWAVDVGRTLGEVNASIWSDNVEFTTITLEFVNGTQVSFWRDSVANANVQVESVNDKFWIYVTVAGSWSHNYQ